MKQLRPSYFEILFALFLIWLSFFPEPILVRYAIYLNCILAAILLCSLSRKGFALCRFFLGVPGLAFWGYMFLLSCSIWAAPDRKQAIDLYLRISLPAGLLFFLARNEISLISAKRIFYPLVLCAGVVSALAVIEALFRRNYIYDYLVANYFYSRFIIEGRAMSTLIHPNILGSYLVTCIPLAHFFYAEKKHNFVYGLLHAIIFALVILGTFLTFSRSSWFACFLMLAVWFIIIGKKKQVLIIFLAAILLILFATLPFLSGSPLGRFSKGSLWDYLMHRHRIWAYIITARMLIAHPFAGVGLGYYRQLFPEYAGFSRDPEIMIPDSIYLMHLAEGGLIALLGLVLFLFIIIKEICCFWGIVGAYNRKFLTALMMSFFGLLFNMAFYDGFLWKTPLYLFWMIAGALIGIIGSKAERLN